MASTTVFLIYTCALLPLLAAENEYGGNSGGKPCVFPFTYMGKTYYFCTTKNSHKPWCATTGSYDEDKIWSYCGNMSPVGDSCSFPFKFNNTFYTTCIPDNTSDGKPWCSSTKNYDLDQRRVFCQASGSCQFPFIYKDKLYYSCTSDGTTDGQLWCATTPNYDKARRWKTCVLKAYGGNSNGAPCWFPFKYKEKIYHNCTSVDEPSGKLWCATTEDYNIEGKWAFCGDPAPPPAEEKNGTCVFPFTYKGETYTFCTTKGTVSGRLWCSLTSNYNLHKRWKYCNTSAYGGNSNGVPCWFPFKYKEKIYHNCTSVDEPSGKLWCATTEDYNIEGKWAFCGDPAPPPAEEKESTCVFPFIYEGESYSSCTTKGTVSGRPWCSLTSNYTLHKIWKYCDSSEREKGCSQQS